MKKLLLWVITVFMSVKIVNAQDVMIVKHEFSSDMDYVFNGEWHYLTSDLYLFNGSKFQDIINSLYINRQKKKKTGSDLPQNVFITAAIEGTPLQEVCYPVFNFAVSEGENGARTYATDSYDAIRLIDNLPISSLNGKVDCKINAEILTKEKENRIFEKVLDFRLFFCYKGGVLRVSLKAHFLYRGELKLVNSPYTKFSKILKEKRL